MDSQIHYNFLKMMLTQHLFRAIVFIHFSDTHLHIVKFFPGLELLSDFDKTQDTGPRCWLRPAATTPSLATAGRRLVNECVASQWF